MPLNLSGLQNGDSSDSGNVMTGRLLKIVYTLIISVSFVSAMNPDAVVNEKQAESFLLRVSAVSPFSGYQGTAFYPQIIPYLGEWTRMPALGFTGRLTDKYSFFVTGGANLGKQDPWFFNSYGLSMIAPMNKYPGEWVIQLLVIHADHPDWKNRQMEFSCGGFFRFYDASAGLTASVSYENGAVRSAGGPYHAEMFFMSLSLLASWHNWHIKIRRNSESAGIVISRRIEL
jgi:hypothetical protein